MSESKFDEFIFQLRVNELNLTNEEKANVRFSVRLLLNNGATYQNAITIAQLLLATFQNETSVTDSFRTQHLENDPVIYSSPEVFMAFYLLMLAGKVSNQYYIKEEISSGICSTYSITCPCDKESCSMCKAKYHEGTLYDCTYNDIPPYHVGCRCGILFHK